MIAAILKRLPARLTGGRPMEQHVDITGFRDIVSDMDVYYWRDRLGRDWMAEGSCSRFRVRVYDLPKPPVVCVDKLKPVEFYSSTTVYRREIRPARRALGGDDEPQQSFRFADGNPAVNTWSPPASNYSPTFSSGGGGDFSGGGGGGSFDGGGDSGGDSGGSD